jgi:60 kDa SS-A/Ro ribonucleoprotein
MGNKDIYAEFSTRATPQSEPIPGKDMVEGRAGGYVFQMDKWGMLDRFLILGTAEPTYYASARELLVENANSVLECIKENGVRTVSRTVEISTEGRAPKNDPALFVLALAASYGNDATRRWALGRLPDVARIGTHLFHFAKYVSGQRGWGRGLRRAVAAWYNAKDPKQLAYQMVKYQQRDGWSHRDLLRLSHPKPATDAHNVLYQWALRGYGGLDFEGTEMAIIAGYEKAKVADTETGIVQFIDTFGLTREMLPTEWLNRTAVWEALLKKMPMTAMIRNLGKMTSVGLIRPMSNAEKYVVTRLGNSFALTNARVHPIQALVALKTYQNGAGFRGKLTWDPTARVVDALDEAFYACFGNVKASGKRTMLALDVSGSMTFKSNCLSAMANMTARDLSAAIAMVTARTEPEHMFVGFTSKLTPLNISPRQRLDDVIRTISGLPFGRTDCAQPMLYALKENVAIDTFVIYTDNETWFGRPHPSQALQLYRQKTSIPAKLIVVGMTANSFSIADPNDAGMLDVVGFDTGTPNLITDFASN